MSGEQTAASFRSAKMLREANRRHTRSAYNPEQRYKLAPTEQSEIGWGIADKYCQASAKFCDGAAWHARTGQRPRLEHTHTHIHRPRAAL